MANLHNLRNFCIIAHIDHGKSTLADRFLQLTHVVDERKFQDQLLDDMELERERGITIKSHPVVMQYTAKDGNEYTFNLIDTPGHVDFSYEVSRSLAACEGALLLIDAGQGVQAQTVANVNLAIRQNLAIIPIINKIDLPAADIDLCLEQLEEILTIPAEEAIMASAKEGIGIELIFEAIINRIPPPETPGGNEIKALIFDSLYDSYRGVVSYVRMLCGALRAGARVRYCASGVAAELREVGVFAPDMTPCDELGPGTVGYVIPNLKSPADARIGDTITGQDHPCREPLPGFQEARPMVFSGIYPLETADYEALVESMARLQLNDAALTFQPETSAALGFGLRCGFLGLLHMEITQERLRREYGMDIIATYPSVIYHVHLEPAATEKERHPWLEVDNPLRLPDPATIDHLEEPLIKASLMAPAEYIGVLMNLILEKRGICLETLNVDRLHVMLMAELPLAEIVIDFHDRLKTITRGYGSLDYEPAGYRAADLVKLEMHVNGEPVDAFASIVHRQHAPARGRLLAERLKQVIPRHLFKIAIQAVAGGKVVAREDLGALRKDVTAKCYGGDVSRKRKLLEKQKAGKKKMKQIGKVNIPQEAFSRVLQTNK